MGLQHPPLGGGGGGVEGGVSCAAKDSATSRCLSMDLPPREPAGFGLMPAWRSLESVMGLLCRDHLGEAFLDRAKM